jgi:hypothetical protein
MYGRTGGQGGLAAREIENESTGPLNIVERRIQVAGFFDEMRGW